MSSTFKANASPDDLLKESLCVEEAKRNPVKFEVLYNTYYERIFRFAYQRVDEKQIAFDITQQVFMKAMLNIQTYQYRGFPFSSWLYRIARNELNLLFRKNSSHRTVNIEETDLRYVADEMSALADPSSAGKVEALDEYSTRLPDVIAELDEEDLQLVEMRFFEKRAFKEIADILDITENNAKVKLYRILGKMKDAILNK